MSLQVSVLGSGSGGNVTVLRCTSGDYLIDAGLSAKQIVIRLEQMGVSPDNLAGIFLTHEHSDHTRGLDVFLRQRNIPIYANALTKEALEYSIKSEIKWKVFQTGQAFTVDDMSVTAFPIPHDAAEPVGFILKNEYACFGLVTDVGYITQSMRIHLREVDALFVEANYDEALLEADTKRPWATKQRITSKHGHLSNTQAGELIAAVGCEKLCHVLLGHLSSDCNNAQVALDTVSPFVQSVGNARLVCANQFEPTDWVKFGREADLRNSKKQIYAKLNGKLVQEELF